MLIALIQKVLHKTIKIEHWKIFLMGFIFFVLSSFIVYLLEPNEYKNPLNGFWFVMTTVSQVGFGDYIPKTIWGRLYTVVLYLFGVGFFAIIIAKWVDLVNKYEELKEQEIMGYTGKDHMVMINWSLKAKETIEQLIKLHQKIDIVLIDQLNNSPINDPNIHFVKGSAAKIDTLERANVLDAKSVCIFGPDHSIDNIAADGKTLLIASTIKQLANKKKSNLYIIAEILDEDHITNTDLNCINEFILSNKPFSYLMAKTALQQQHNIVKP
ncbi:potassium channel protein [Halalkalibacter alkaliphilus]|uniref:Ion channel n=1 Tax=Halalkalibacter alkaliphilus TaxID=2917993 RepID=A0A9X1ZY70_9BACI|nr:potassium channel family protein [Halalkalibacter alkaliphilus]MCL7745837.1 ion channel [Halalkalibacter alkaliphilus]